MFDEKILPNIYVFYCRVNTIKLVIDVIGSLGLDLEIKSAGYKIQRMPIDIASLFINWTDA